MRSMNLDWERPGIRKAGEVKMIRRDGYGRTRRYYTCKHEHKDLCENTYILVDTRQPPFRSKSPSWPYVFIYGFFHADETST